MFFTIPLRPLRKFQSRKNLTSFPVSFYSSSLDNRNLPKIPSLQTLLKRGFTPTLKSINQLLLFLSHSQRFNSIVHLFSQLHSNKIKPNSQTHSILTWALLKLHKFEEAEHLMKSSSCPKTRYWDSLIQGFGVIQNNPDKGLLLLKDCLRNHDRSTFILLSISMIQTKSTKTQDFSVVNENNKDLINAIWVIHGITRKLCKVRD